MWKARKRIWCGLPWTFTVYSFDEERLYVESGILNKEQSEMRLYRILDISLTRSFIQRIFGMGTIHLTTSDRSDHKLDLINVKEPKEVKEQLSQKIEACRDSKRVSTREFIGDDFGDGETDADGDL